MSERTPRKSGGGRVTPKTPRPSPSPQGLGDGAPPTLPVETLHSLLGDLEHLRTAEPLAIEIRASFAWGLMQRSHGLELFRAVVATLNDGLRRGSPDARDYMRLLATVAETGVAKQFAQLLRQAAIIALPPRWVNHAGRAVVEQAYIYEYELGDTYTVNLICRYPGAEGQHEIVAFIDGNFGWFVDIGAFGMASPINDDDLGDVRRREIPLDEARAHIERALGFAPALMDHPDAAKIVSRLRLIAHYVESLPEGFDLAERQPMADDQRDAIVDAFLQSAHGQTLVDLPELSDEDPIEIVKAVVVTAHDLLDGQPLRLTPQSIELLLMALQGSELDDKRIALVPAVLRSFVPYAQEQNGWGDRFLADTLLAIR